ncbi:hypothetical protein OLVG_00116 [Ostreococcus lucimarinus virus OlV6]|mgnify:FL=1|jgi:hypothetical protein|uniref:hypothetical protein n=1 Tax=Ostreococcus tauri virus 2 TaxID=696472 RepID=UPI0001EF4655|nr:hypothetical protein OtV2_124 [Ostreococcus tauri virus 2]YP_007674761.1 hypothetical protein OLNG_00119 [Ostreococcus lucimarinus virus OlV5]AFK65870.1 hypothetical protein OLVG_00116 [Ostreococcus lucimarinus virus OlV6]AGH31192.1 hypothetical protein OLNG_00119 [Ostreococcus lucimarinus virus OlV5]CBI70123.1 hypothetical protein OtV2_124 [Ostreococcus tauri virus 2]|tara:strand:+ start:264 stop:494 length:231 start_codon:yes stop_codon:yes gene_type:complete
MLNIADFDEAYANKPTNVEQIPCQPPACFVGSYAPVSKPGEEGRFFNNTYLLQKDRKFETFGTVKVRSGDIEKCLK